MSPQKRRKKATPEDSTRRLTLYMTESLYTLLESQSQVDGISMSGLTVNLLSLFLASPQGQKLKEEAKQQHRTLIQQLENDLLRFEKELSPETLSEIQRLAELSERSLDQMILYLVKLGLRIYKMRIESDLNEQL
ncbi:hypothetical protein WA1_00850 [Scytonema hofmannii PCC 7110]|uniref:Uncharacterized protein n=1 Tax=Scytonema hofmannii PCC 7110 TaxID=128403 RepID=A0A139XGB7_9CYAN|nr:hypothetical protein [Scytonema hofmannii]KYC43745.1 hypothetical protein WA1_00850 [Scytonema hofmannii PCC 7110]